MKIKDTEGQYLLECKQDRGMYNLCGVNLHRADLHCTNLFKANLLGTDLSSANLVNTNLRGSNLCGANLCGANLCGANLYDADLSGAYLGGADLTGAYLIMANLRGADLTGAKGLIKEKDWLDANLEKTEEGYICYKSFGEYYNSPKNWVIEENSIIEDKNINQDRREDCAPGINVGTKDWCNEYCFKQIWKCLLKFEWMDEVCVPYGTDGKFRCGKLQIIKKEVV